MLGIAVLTIKYLVELRGWSGIALASVHSRDAKIYIDDPGPWIMGLATEMRYAVRPPPEVCVVDLYAFYYVVIWTMLISYQGYQLFELQFAPSGHRVRQTAARQVPATTSGSL